MEQKKYGRRARRHGENDILSAYLRTAIAVLIGVAVISVIWMIIKPFVSRAERMRLDSAEASSSLQEAAVDAEAADGSGQAGRSVIPATMSVRFDSPGWQHDNTGWWYASDENTYYTNGWMTLDGAEYHFNARGYMDTGWTTVGGRGCYFDENGVYDKNADSSKLIALTYDDGPGESTSRLLDILEENDVRATFFILGEMAERYGAENLPRMVRLGCELGNHSYDHANMKEVALDEALEQFSKTDDIIEQYSGVRPDVLRFPYGSFTDELEAKVGKPSIYWDFDTNDWKGPEPEDLADLVISEVSGGNIILMHDIHENSIDATEIMIPKLKELGYEFVTVRELAAARGYQLESGVTYFGFSDTDIEHGRVTDKESD